MATIIEFFVPSSFKKKGDEVDTAGRIWEGDPVQPATKEVCLTPHCCRDQGVYTFRLLVSEDIAK
jgi:hypothetical protein